MLTWATPKSELVDAMVVSRVSRENKRGRAALAAFGVLMLISVPLYLVLARREWFLLGLAFGGLALTRENALV